MSYREDFLSQRLGRYLKRRTVPRGLADSIEAQMDEMRALLAVLTRKAPRDDYEDWWDAVERSLGENAETRAWPDEAEMSKACTAAYRGVRVGDSEARTDWVLDPHAVMAKRIKAKEAVGEDWVYGRLCVEMIQKGLVSEHELRPYRLAIYQGFKDTATEAEADRRVAELQRKHEMAKAVLRDDASAFNPGGAYTYRPRMMSDAIARPRPGHADFVVDREVAEDPTTEAIAARPYTDAERARMAALGYGQEAAE